MENIKQFGIEPLLLTAQIINFLILVYLLKRFLYGPILSILKKREDKIKDGLAAGVKGEAILVKAAEEEKAILGKANEESRILLEEAKQKASILEEEIVDKARQEAVVLMERTRTEIDDDRREMEKLLEKKLVDSSVRVLEVVLPKLLSKQDQIRIIENTEKMLRRTIPQ